MDKFSMEAKVGLFFLAAVAIFIYAWMYVLEFGAKDTFVLKARFRSVEGLEKGAQVQIAGIKIGSVQDITFDPETGKAVVEMAVLKQYLGTVPEDSRVFLKTRGLIGDKYVIIAPGKPNARKLKPGEEIKLIFEPVDTDKILENMGLISQDLKVVTHELRRQVIDEKGSKKFDDILTNSDAVFKDLRAILARNKDKIGTVIDNTESATKKLNELVTRNEKKVNRAVDDMEKFSGTMDKTGEKFGKVVSDLDALTKDVRAGKGTLGKLVTDESLYREAQSLVRDVRQISNRIQYGPGAVGRLINDPELYYEARRAIRNMNKTAEDISEATPVSTLAIIFGSIFR
jgi:phospholipid/cholesterol/gamma-HCH transport system substrate-binding protein